ncbi:unannotated protein [freshwater metagenome]|uniref:Unannotated protein n=1 Tax=freshwater metagenome TaxID=449393 RepID=A0A6J6P5W3_9ZZZZ
MVRSRPQIQATDKVAGRAVAIGVATGVYGLSFGALATAAGVSTAKAVALSALVFTGATQIAVIGVIAGGGGMVSAVANGLVVAMRHLAYGVAVSPLLPDRRPARLLAAHVIIDESTAMGTGAPTRDEGRRAFLLTGASVFVFWNLATFAGAELSRAVASPHALGLDAMFPAAFLALLAPQLRQRRAPAVAAAGALIATLLIPVAPAGIPVLASVAALVLVLRERAS